MQMIIKKQLGKNSYTFVVEGKNLHDLVMESEKFSFGNLSGCGICKGDNLVLNAYITREEEYKYVKVVCLNCKASLTFGQQKKSPDTFYYRKTEAGALEWKEFEQKQS